MRAEGHREREDSSADPRMAEGLWVRSTLSPASEAEGRPYCSLQLSERRW